MLTIQDIAKFNGSMIKGFEHINLPTSCNTGFSISGKAEPAPKDWDECWDYQARIKPENFTSSVTRIESELKDVFGDIVLTEGSMVFSSNGKATLLVFWISCDHPLYPLLVEGDDWSVDIQVIVEGYVFVHGSDSIPDGIYREECAKVSLNCLSRKHSKLSEELAIFFGE